jgi:glycosyltransferase involved in cell wall biosynthesis
MKIVVCTVAAKAQKTIVGTIHSVRNQKIPPGVEVDHHFVIPPEDRLTALAIHQAGVRIDHVHFEDRPGIYQAMNQGIDIALNDPRTRLISLLNADDCYQPNTISLVNDAYQENPNADIFYGNLKVVDQAGQIKRIWIPSDELNFKAGEMPPHPTIFAKPECYKETKFSPEFTISADFKLLRDLYNKGKEFVHINEFLVFMGEGGVSSKRRWQAFIQDYHVLRVTGFSKEEALWIATRKRLGKIRQFFPSISSGKGLTSKQNS